MASVATGAAADRYCDTQSSCEAFWSSTELSLLRTGVPIVFPQALHGKGLPHNSWESGESARQSAFPHLVAAHPLCYSTASSSLLSAEGTRSILTSDT